MLEAITYPFGVIFLMLFLFFALTDAGFVIGTLLLPIIRWIQKAIFGIDKPKAGPEILLGRMVTIRSNFKSQGENKGLEGFVVIDGESWKARSFAAESELRAGAVVRVAERHGLELLVKPCNDAS